MKRNVSITRGMHALYSEEPLISDNTANVCLGLKSQYVHTEFMKLVQKQLATQHPSQEQTPCTPEPRQTENF